MASLMRDDLLESIGESIPKETDSQHSSANDGDSLHFPRHTPSKTCSLEDQRPKPRSDLQETLADKLYGPLPLGAGEEEEPS